MVIKRIKTLIIIIILFGILIYGFLLVKKRVPDNLFCFKDIGTPDIPQYFIEINKSTIIGQSFVSNFSDLFRISIFLSKENTSSDGVFYFHLKYKKDDKDDIVFKKWNFSELYPERNNFYQIPPDPLSKKGFHFHINFPPIGDSKDKEFYFYFETSDTQKEGGPKLGLWDRKYYENMTYGKMYVNHHPRKGFLAFRTYNTWSGNFSDVVDNIGYRLMKDKIFLIFYVFLIIGIIYWILVLSLKIKKLQKDNLR